MSGAIAGEGSGRLIDRSASRRAAPRRAQRWVPREQATKASHRPIVWQIRAHVLHLSSVESALDCFRPAVMALGWLIATVVMAISPGPGPRRMICIHKAGANG